MLALVLALALLPSGCSMTIGIGADGSLFSNRADRLHGWYSIRLKTLGSDLHGGCYNDASPLPVSSVSLFIALNAPKQKVDLVLSILKNYGWNREKVNILPWNAYPKAPDH